MVASYLITWGEDNAPLLTFDEGKKIFVFNTEYYTAEGVSDQYNIAKYMAKIIRDFYLKHHVIILASYQYACIKAISETANLPYIRENVFGLPQNFWSSCPVRFSGDFETVSDGITRFVRRLGFTSKYTDFIYDDSLRYELLIHLNSEIVPLPLVDILPLTGTAVNIGLHELCKSGKFTDFTFEVSKKVFKVHQAVFYVNGGEYLKKLYGQQFKQPEPKMFIDFADDVTVSEYIDYVYLGPDAFTDKNAVDIVGLFQLAVFFGQSDLENHCLNLISIDATPNQYDNLVALYQLAPRPQLKKIIDILKNYLPLDI